jgi:hypothetical protein
MHAANLSVKIRFNAFADIFSGFGWSFYKEHSMSSVIKFFPKFAVFFILFSVCSSSQVSASSNFDYDGKADFAVFRPNDRNWYAYSSEYKAFSAIQWGLPTDRLVPADYDGDGLTDYAVWRPETGVWYVLRSSDKKLFAVQWGGRTAVPGGIVSDEPAAADYDGDGMADFAVFRPSNGVWYVLKSTSGYNHQYAQYFQWGKLGDIPVQADYDGDGKTDFAVFRYTENRWYIFQSKTSSWQTSELGAPSLDLLVPADYTGDGKADVAVFRSGVWIIERSDNGQTEYFWFGLSDDTPAPADYDNDGKTDIAVYRGGTWFILKSSTGQMSAFYFGQKNDVPLNSLNVKHSIVGVP